MTTTKAARETAWRANADAPGAFHSSVGRWPRKGSADPDEKRLAYFTAAARSIATGTRPDHSLPPARREYLDRAAPGWLVDREHEWQLRADAVGAFHREQDRWPFAESGDLSERRLGEWLRDQRSQGRGAPGARPLPDGRRAYLDSVAPSWAQGRDLDAAWLASANAAASFTLAHHRPRHGGTDLLPGELVLSSWVNTQRVASRNGDLTDTRRAHLDLVLPTWLDGRAPRRNTHWFRTADDVAAFAIAHRRTPRTGGSDLPAAEKFLGTWLANNRNAARTGSLPPPRRDYLDRVLPWWLETTADQARERAADQIEVSEGIGSTAAATPPRVLDVRWRTTADQLAAFHRAHQRWPLSRAADPAEQRLGRWLDQQRGRALRRADASAVARRTEYLTRVAPGWDRAR
jgi:hypothetical protein